jgi:hypothetical protein
LAARWTRAVRRILVQALPSFLEIGQQLHGQSAQRLYRQSSKVGIIKLLEIVIAQLHVGSGTPLQGRLNLQPIFSCRTRFVSYPYEFSIGDCWGLNGYEPYTTGRPRATDLREILNAIFYLNKTGCPWRYLPKDFPSHGQTMECGKRSMRHFVGLYAKTEIEAQSLPERLLTANVSREPQSRLSIQGSTGAS